MLINRAIKGQKHFFKISVVDGTHPQVRASGINYCLFFYCFYRGTDQRDSVFAVMILAGVGLVVFLLFRKARLVTQIRADGIYVRFPPLQPSFQRYRWEDIKEAYIREYKPLAEYGGWGIRFGLGGRAYNVSGTIGLQLVFHNGSRVLIGTSA